MMKQTLQLLLSFGVLGAGCLHAATVTHYRFEDGVFLDDSSGNSFNLSTNGTSPASADTDFGAVDFPTTVPQTGASNTGYADFTGTTNSLTAADNAAFTNPSSFTVEAFVSYTNNGALQNVLAQWADGGGSSDRSFRFGINGADKINFGLYDGGTSNFDSTFSLESGDDYYIAATFSDTGANASLTIYAQNLTDGGSLMSDSTTIAFGTLANSPLTLSIGAYDGTDKPFDGAIDEVRLSDTVLSTGELLVSVPEPSATASLLGATALLSGLLRRRRSHGA